jgi:hypothetical protein
MKEIQLSPRLTHEEAAALRGKRMTAANYNTTVGSESVTVLKEDGSKLLVLVKGAVSAKVAGAALPLMRECKGLNDNRGVASGASGQFTNAKRIDGTRGNTNRVNREQSKALGNGAPAGYFDRYPRFPYCRACTVSEGHPDKWKAFLPLVSVVDKVFAQYSQERYTIQKKYMEAIHPAWRIGNTAFTTVTINKNFPTYLHHDAGDLAEGFGAMACITAGKHQGGLLVIPRYGVAVVVESCDVILFDVHEWHGNTEMKGNRFERFTAVMYCRENMAMCGSPKEEIARAQVCRDIGKTWDEDEKIKLKEIQQKILGRTA